MNHCSGSLLRRKFSPLTGLARQYQFTKPLPLRFVWCRTSRRRWGRAGTATSLSGLGDQLSMIFVRRLIKSSIAQHRPPAVRFHSSQLPNAPCRLILRLLAAAAAAAASFSPCLSCSLAALSPPAYALCPYTEPATPPIHLHRATREPSLVHPPQWQHSSAQPSSRPCASTTRHPQPSSTTTPA
jgi:hypothetical protein